MAQAQVVQATCPGCKNVLRIPADWLHKAIRCKHCGTVLQARGPAGTPAQPAAVPPPRSSAVMPAAAPPPPVPPPPPVVAPLAAAVVSPAAGFDFDAPGPDELSPARRRRPRKRGGAWLGLAVVGALLLTVAALGVVFQARIRAGLDTLLTGHLPDDEDGPAANRNAGGKGRGKAPAGAPFPRRALVIDLHNYLYANPIGDSPDPNAANVARLISTLNLKLRIPLTQIVHLSDRAAKPVPPFRQVIEEGLTNFLTTSRAQDRIMVFFIGHSREIDGNAYLVPLEGELDNPATLLPLRWVFDKLARCPARQKILVIDGNRFNPAQGEERPSSGPLGPKFEAMLKAPPAGVQVWSSCSAGQQSQEFEESSLGVFLDAVRQALSPDKGTAALDGKIQQHDDLIPVDVLARKVDAIMAEQFTRRKEKQVAFLSGAAPPTGAEFDPTEKPAALPALPVVRRGDVRLVKEIMNDVSLPPLKVGEGGSSDVTYTQLPPFPAARLAEFAGGQLPADSKVRQAVHDARITLWAISPAEVPPDLKAEVEAERQKLRIDLAVLGNGRYNHPGAAEAAFKNKVSADSMAVARIVARLDLVLEKLTADEVKEEAKKAPKRWRLNYEFVIARFHAQLAHLEEFNGLLGQLRKGFPEPFDPNVHTGWKMASKEKASDSLGKKYDKAARAQFTRLAEENPQTPWAVLARREKLTAIGLEWQPF